MLDDFCACAPCAPTDSPASSHSIFRASSFSLAAAFSFSSRCFASLSSNGMVALPRVPLILVPKALALRPLGSPVKLAWLLVEWGLALSILRSSLEVAIASSSMSLNTSCSRARGIACKRHPVPEGCDEGMARMGCMHMDMDMRM